MRNVKLYVMERITKYSIVAFFLLIISPVQVWSQHDKISTAQGDVTLMPINHATLAIQWGQEVVYIDPAGDHKYFKDIPKPTMVLITDIHGDHFSLPTLDRMAAGKLPVVAPPAVANGIPRHYEQVRVLPNGQSLDLKGIKIEAVPMYNLPETENSRHPKGRGNGYILTIGGKRIYISGDTSGIPEMRTLQNIDVAFVCMNLPYTMDVAEAAGAVSEFKPTIVYPYHFRGKNGYSDVKEFKRLVETDEIEVRLRTWYF